MSARPAPALSTTARAVPECEPPATHVPTRAELFTEPLTPELVALAPVLKLSGAPFGLKQLPNIEYIKLHLKREGRLNHEHVTDIIAATAAIWRSEPNVLEVPAPATGSCTLCSASCY